MTYVITFPCIGVKDASCVDVCPVDCIHPAPNEAGFEEAEQLYINPDECIDCGACENAVAIRNFSEEEVLDFVRFARRKAYVMRWIEFMPLDADQQWRKEDILPGHDRSRNAYLPG